MGWFGKWHLKWRSRYTQTNVQVYKLNPLQLIPWAKAIIPGFIVRKLWETTAHGWKKNKYIKKTGYRMLGTVVECFSPEVVKPFYSIVWISYPTLTAVYYTTYLVPSPSSKWIHCCPALLCSMEWQITNCFVDVINTKTWDNGYLEHQSGYWRPIFYNVIKD